MFGTRILTYNREEIENFINSYEYQELWNSVKRGKYLNMEE